MGASASSVQERYFLQKVKLGQGSFGTVWRAVDKKMDTTVAVKQMDKSKFAQRGVKRADVEQEISTMKILRHENITQLHDTFEDKQFIYLALEYCDGGDFGDKLKERAMSIQEDEVSSWTRQILSAIQCMHSKRICHRDVKPDNFMISGEGVLKLSDFGLAVHLPQGKLLTDKCGTPAFMSPEQHLLPRQSKGYGMAADVWAAGLCMYMILVGGQHPFLGDNGQMDHHQLMQGALDFKPRHSFLGVDISGAMSSTRGSDASRELCRAMVQPHWRNRIGAGNALLAPFLRSPRAVGVTDRVGRVPPPSAMKVPVADAPSSGMATSKLAQPTQMRKQVKQSLKRVADMAFSAAGKPS